MSHFTLAVLTDGTKTVEELLAPYDENLEVKQYIKDTKAEIIEKAREMKEMCLKDKAEGKKISKWMEKYINAETDEELYQCYIDEDETYDADGNRLSTYNPKSKWDWWVAGGRWSDKLATTSGINCDSALVSNIIFPEDFSTFAVLLPNGEWFEKGEMGWFACVSNKKEDWQAKYKERFINTANPEWILTIVDCHI